MITSFIVLRRFSHARGRLQSTGVCCRRCCLEMLLSMHLFNNVWSKQITITRKCKAQVLSFYCHCILKIENLCEKVYLKQFLIHFKTTICDASADSVTLRLHCIIVLKCGSLCTKKNLFQEASLTLLPQFNIQFPWQLLLVWQGIRHTDTAET